MIYTGRDGSCFEHSNCHKNMKARAARDLSACTMCPAGNFQRNEASCPVIMCSSQRCANWMCRNSEKGGRFSCGKCKLATYCSKECQVSNWKFGGHKQKNVCALPGFDISKSEFFHVMYCPKERCIRSESSSGKNVASEASSTSCASLYSGYTGDASLYSSLYSGYTGDASLYSVYTGNGLHCQT